MSRTLPLCAYCGKDLWYADRVLLQFDGMKGKPQIGWHQDHYNEDVARPPRDGPIPDPQKLIDEIQNRGRYRVVKLRRDSQSGKWGYS